MIVTTTSSIDGHNIIEYLGICTGEAIIGANIVRDVFANVRDIVGGRSGSYETIIRDGKDTAIAEMQAQALQMGANAIVGVDLDYEVVGDRGSMLMVVASGTAVIVNQSTYQESIKKTSTNQANRLTPKNHLGPLVSEHHTEGHSAQSEEEQEPKRGSFGRAKMPPSDT
jgi:uncharacterized protein YbjQ (UPF0145 family)